MKTSLNKQIQTSRSDLADRLLVLREARGLTQQELADAARIDRKTVNRIENERFSPSIDTLFRLCGVLNTTPSRVLKGIDVK